MLHNNKKKIFSCIAQNVSTTEREPTKPTIIATQVDKKVTIIFMIIIETYRLLIFRIEGIPIGQNIP